jgi:hypothetical protein
MIPKRLKMSFHSIYWQALRPTLPLTLPPPVIIICCVPSGTSSSQNAGKQQLRIQIGQDRESRINCRGVSQRLDVVMTATFG